MQSIKIIKITQTIPYNEIIVKPDKISLKNSISYFIRLFIFAHLNIRSVENEDFVQLAETIFTVRLES